MCGICGVYDQQGVSPADARLVQDMCDALVHRGPDGQGMHAEPHLVMGMRRLAVIDLATGDQPMANEDRTVWVVNNGEIYNYCSLTRELEQHGHRFATASDTEVIVHAYEQWGDGFVQHLGGMFALALWDAKEQRLILARDRLGKKPLYYRQQGGRLVFGSELGALARDASFDRCIDPMALHHYLTLQYVPEPLSIYQGVRKLEPGHTLVCERGQVRTKRYWDLAFVPKFSGSQAEAEEELRRLTDAAVARRMVSDVDLGAFLSGGLDSSVVVGLMARRSERPVKTFSIGFDEAAFSELPHARQVAERWSTEHHEFVLTPRKVPDMVSTLAACFDEPFADSAALQTYYLAELCSREVTVVLTGDGGDEVFGGYPRYWLDRWVQPYVALPRFITQQLMPTMLRPLAETGDKPVETDWVLGLKRLAQVADTTPKASIIRWGSFFSHPMKADLYQPLWAEQFVGVDTCDLLAKDFERAQAEDFLDRTLYVDTMNYLPGNNLAKTDRMTMAHSLEARSPLLDHELVEFAASLPCKWKVDGRSTKHIFRQAFADLLDPVIAKRPKQGFASPMEQWIRQGLVGWAQDMLLSPESLCTAYLRPAGMAKLLEQHRQGRINHGRRIWALLMLEAWLRHDHGLGD